MPSRDPYRFPSSRRSCQPRRSRRSRLSLESLEFRRLLAADNLASIAGVVFNDINNDGIFDEGTDVPLRDVTVTLTREGDPVFRETATTDVDGLYRFDELAAGIYTVTQEPVDGLSQNPSVTQQVVTKTIEDATGVSGPTIDSFETPVAVTASGEVTPAFAFVDAATTEIVGGQRELAADLTSEFGFATLAVNPSGAPLLELDSAAASSSERSVIWDGSADGGAPGLDFGLNLDLTAGGSDALVLRVLFDDLPIDLTVRFYLNATDFSETTISLPGGIFTGPEAFVVPFDQFVENDDGADLTNVRAIELFHDPSAPAVDAQIEYIGTIGPMRADFPNIELGVAIEKETNGVDADEPTGPNLPVGEMAQFTYAVTNTGNPPLSIMEIIDDNGTPEDESDDFSPDPIEADGVNVGDDNSNGLVDGEEIWQFEASRTVTPGQYTNIVTVTAEEPNSGATISDEDPSNHFGILAAIDIEKATNGEDADEPTGPVVTVGETVDFSYEVSNAGNEPLTITSVVDDNGTPDDETDDFSPEAIEVEGINVGDLNANGLLDEEEVWQYAASRTATAGQYTNIGTVLAIGPEEQIVTDSDPSNHLGAGPAITIEKRTNGEDADEPTGPLILVDETAFFTYEVSNSGNLPLTITTVSDDNGTPEDPDDDFAPAAVEVEGVNVGDTNADGRLDLDETWQYEASRVVTIGQYRNVGSVSAFDPREVVVTDSDPSHHLGIAAGVDIEKLTNGEDADTPTGPLIPVGDEVMFVYEVRNLGNVPFTVSTITDDNGTPDDPNDDFTPDPILVDGFNVGDGNMNGQVDADEVWLYDTLTTATPGQYTNIGQVEVFTDFEDSFTDSDPSNHFGLLSQIQIEKQTNGEDADTTPGPLVPVGDEVRFTYEVSNPGNVPLLIVSVDDDNGTPADDSDDFPAMAIENDGVNVGDTNADGLLDEGETWLYEATRIATPRQHSNIGEVIALDPNESLVVDEDPSHHWGVVSSVEIQKLTNGEDADAPTGPLVPVGDEVRFEYQISTQANVPLSITSVSDDNGTPGDPSDDLDPSPIESEGINVGDINGDGLLDQGERWLYEATRTVTAGQFTNVGSVIAEDAIDQVVTDEDPSNHFGVVPGVDVELIKKTNGEDANDAPGVFVFVGNDARFLYEVSNSGEIPFEISSLSDDDGTPGDPSDDFAPAPIESEGSNVGDSNMNGLVDTDETWLFEAFRVVTAGQYTNTATVEVIGGEEQTDTDSDVSNHFGVDPNPDVALEKSTNGEDADAEPGPSVPIGDEVLFEYEVSNPGNALLTITGITDDAGTAGDPSDDFSPSPVEVGDINVGDENANGLLDPSETWLYEATGIVTEGQYTNIATVTAEGLLGTTVADSDASNHFGFDAGVRAEVIVIGNDKGPSSTPLVTLLDGETNAVVGQFLAYEAEFAGGVRVATGDMDGDGVDEIITAPGKSRVPEIRVFSRGTADDPDVWGELIEFRTLAYVSEFAGGVNLAVGDVDGDGRNDIVTTPSRGAVETKVFRNVFGDGDDPIDDDPYRQFFAFGPDFISGSVVSLADMNLDGLPEVVVGNVGGMRSTINVFDVSGSPDIIQNYFPFSEQMRGGVSIALSKINLDDVPELVVGAGYRGQSVVEVIDGDSGNVLDSFTAYGDANAPVRLAVQGDRIVTAQGPNGNTNQIRRFDLIFDNAGLIVVPDPDATLNLNDLDDSRLFGAYYLDVIDLFDVPTPPDDSGPTDEPVDEPVDEPIDEPVDEPVDEPLDDADAEPQREASGVSGTNEVVDRPTRVPGDSNGDGIFDSSDLVAVFAAGQYEDDVAVNSTFETGDWDGDGDFTSSDLVFVFRQGNYGRPARDVRLLANVDPPMNTDLADVSRNLIARDRWFGQDEELWSLRDLLDDDGDL